MIIENGDSRSVTQVAGVELVEFVLSGHTDSDGVRLETGFGPGRGADFERAVDGWRLAWPRPDIDRLEYQFTMRHNGSSEWTTDPGNPRTVPNPFGSKSELEFDEYAPPGWLSHELTGDLRGEVDVGAPYLQASIPTRVWTSAALSDGAPAPLLLVHDGSDMADRGGLLRWASSLGRPLRIALLDPAPGARDDWYSANSDYTATVTERVLPDLISRWATSTVVGLGASLGAVATLALARRGILQGAMLQSGSFFTSDLDPQESNFPYFDRVRAFTVAPLTVPSLPVVISCGTVEENRANNERMAGLLSAAGCPVDFRLIRDAHTMICWRDAWFGALDKLL